MDYEEALKVRLVNEGSGVFFPNMSTAERKVFHDRLRRIIRPHRARTLVAAYLGNEGTVFWAERK